LFDRLKKFDADLLLAKVTRHLTTLLFYPNKKSYLLRRNSEAIQGKTF